MAADERLTAGHLLGGEKLRTGAGLVIGTKSIDQLRSRLLLFLFNEVSLEVLPTGAVVFVEDTRVSHCDDLLCTRIADLVELVDAKTKVLFQVL